MRGDMIDLLIKLLCYEYDITIDLMFSKGRDGKIIKSIALMSYILHVEKGMLVSDIYKEYKSRGYKKSRTALYNSVKRGCKLINSGSYYYGLYKSMLSALESGKEGKVFLENDTSFHIVLGRILQKIYKVKSLRHLDSIESNISSFLQTEFLHIGDLEKEEDKFKI